MPTYIFKSKHDGTLIRATALSLNQAREDAEKASPPKDHIYNACIWPAWECWEGGVCIWHVNDGDVVAGPRPK